MLALAAACSRAAPLRRRVGVDVRAAATACGSTARSGCGGAARLEALAQAKLRRAFAPPCSRALSSAAQGDVRRYASAAPPRLPRLWCFTQGELLASGRGAATSQPLCPLVTTQPSLSLISTQWFALRAHSSAVSNSSSAMSVNLATKRSAEETPLAAEEHYKSDRSTPSGFCNFRAGSADTYPQHSTYHSILHLHS